MLFLTVLITLTPWLLANSLVDLLVKLCIEQIPSYGIQNLQGKLASSRTQMLKMVTIFFKLTSLFGRHKPPDGNGPEIFRISIPPQNKTSNYTGTSLSINEYAFSFFLSKLRAFSSVVKKSCNVQTMQCLPAGFQVKQTVHEKHTKII